KDQKFQNLNPIETALYNKYVRFRGRPQCFKITPPNHIVYYPCSTYVASVDAAINSSDLRTLPLITVGGYMQTASQILSASDFALPIVLTPPPGVMSGFEFDQGLPFDTVRQALATSHDPPGVRYLVEHVNAEAN